MMRVLNVLIGISGIVALSVVRSGGDIHISWVATCAIGWLIGTVLAKD